MLKLRTPGMLRECVHLHPPLYLLKTFGVGT